MRRHRDEPHRQRSQQAEHLVHILVRHDAHKEHELLPGEAVFQTLHCGPHTVGVVAAVQQEGRFMPQQFEAARPAHSFQAGADGAFGDIPAVVTHHPQGCDGHSRVPRLIAADEGQMDIGQSVEVKLHCVEVSTVIFQFIEIHLGQLSMLFRADAADDGVCFRHAAVAHHRAAFFDDARLGCCNVRNGGPKLLDVIHAQCRDHCTFRRINDVGGVQCTAKAHFQHHDVALLLCKIEHSQRCDNLKFGGHIGHGVRGRLHLFHQLHQFAVWDLHAVHLNALIEAVDEGGRVQAHPIARRLQTAGCHGGGAAFAVGARNVDEFEPFVRVAQRCQQCASAGQTGFVARPLDGVDVFQGLFVVHR